MLRSIGVGGQFLFIVSQFISDRRLRVRLESKASVSVDLVSRVPNLVFSTVVTYIVRLRALPHCWEPYGGLCG